MDHTVQLHELPPSGLGTSYRLDPSARGAAAGFPNGGVPGGRRGGGTGGVTRTAQQRSTVYFCHRSRVKVGSLGLGWGVRMEDGWVGALDDTLMHDWKGMEGLAAGKSGHSLLHRLLSLCLSAPLASPVKLQASRVKVVSKHPACPVICPLSGCGGGAGQPARVLVSRGGRAREAV